MTLLENRLEVEATRHRGELATAAERADRSQERLEKALTDLRAETELRAAAQASTKAADHRIEELKGELVALRGEAEAPEKPPARRPAPAPKKKPKPGRQLQWRIEGFFEHRSRLKRDGHDGIAMIAGRPEYVLGHHSAIKGEVSTRVSR